MTSLPTSSEALSASTDQPSFSDDDLRQRYTLEHGGPNPYYLCKECGESVPGLRELLVEHAARHEPATPDQKESDK